MILLIGDMHINARNSSVQVMENHIKFWENTIFPLIKNNKIKDIIQTGDLLDVRKFSNHYILHTWKRRVFDVLESLKVNFHVIVGNHDMYFKHDVDVNSINVLFKEYKNIKLYSKVSSVTIDNKDFIMVPWICDTNREEVYNYLESADKSSTVVGHFELLGFDVMKNNPADIGDYPDFLRKFSKVISGHYHTQSKLDNIHYIGTPAELTWGDYDDPKGIWLLSDDMKFIKNEYPLHVKYVYDDTTPVKLDYSLASGSYVRLIVVNKSHITKFDNVIKKIEEQNPIEFRIIDEIDIKSDSDNDIESENISTENLLDYLKDVVESIETELDKDILYSEIKELYLEGINT